MSAKRPTVSSSIASVSLLASFALRNVPVSNAAMLSPRWKQSKMHAHSGSPRAISITTGNATARSLTARKNTANVTTPAFNVVLSVIVVTVITCRPAIN